VDLNFSTEVSASFSFDENDLKWRFDFSWQMLLSRLCFFSATA